MDVLRRRWNDNRFIRMLQRADRLVENLRMHRRLALAQMALVIQPDRQYLRRLAGMEQLDFGQLLLPASFFVIAEDVALQLANGVPI